MSRVLVIGDVVLDRDLLGTVERVCPDAPVPVVDVRDRRDRAGAAGLAATLLAARADVQVTLATCIGTDEAGARVRGLLAGRADVLELAEVPGTRSLTRVRSNGQSLLRLDADGGGPLDPGAVVDLDALREALARCDAVLVSDYGAGVVSHPAVREVLATWVARRPVVWDPHPRGLAPVPGVTVATPNRAECGHFARLHGTVAGPHLDRTAVTLREVWQAHAVAATDGAAGVLTALADSPPLFTPAPTVDAGDACGAGDCFAGSVAAALAAGAVITEAVGEAVVDTAAWLACGGVAALEQASGPGAGGTAATGPVSAGSVVFPATGAIRAGGTLVATGGCFDVVHAGHVASLQAARRLGDRLVVLLNSDASVRRLKGDQRPVHPVADRVVVLESLECVDAVVVFDEDTPAEALATLRPDIWAKGGDYAAATMPEAELVERWGGRVVLLPYLPGRSTTRILSRTDPSRTDPSRTDASRTDPSRTDPRREANA